MADEHRKFSDDLINKDRLDEVWVDSTPDGNYAIRILRAFRLRCDAYYRVTGVSEERQQMYDLLNQLQKERAAELDQAIELLSSPRPNLEVW